MAKSTLNSGNTQAEELTKTKITKQSIQNISELLRYLKPYKVKFAFGMLFLLLSSLTGLAFPSLLGAMIDAASIRMVQQVIDKANLYGMKND